MTKWMDDLAVVVELACETAWREDKEQRALLRVAHKVDTERAKQTTTNKEWVSPWLEQHVDETRSLDSDHHPVPRPSLKKKRGRA